MRSATICAMVALLALPAQAQNQVKCWEVPNGVNRTIQCENGYWITTTPEGETITGNGMTDPSAGAQGSGIIINRSTGGPTTTGQNVTAPTQQLQTLAPYQAQTYGMQPRQD